MAQRSNVAIIRSDDDYVEVEKVLDGRHDTALKYVSQYASFSEKIYGREDSNINKWVNNWEKLDFHFDDFRPESKKGIWLEGLKVESYFKKEGEFAYVVIVFRGTRFTKWQDWYSNFNVITRFIPFVHNSYRQIILQINEYINAIAGYLINDRKIANSIQNIKFSSAGHSLGGGLAQQAAYASKHIETVYAFDPSPVTGYSSIKKTDRKINCEGLKIYRIWEHGEILLYLRMITKAARKIAFIPNLNPRIVEVRFNFAEKVDTITEHSMQDLALSMIGAEKSFINLKKIDDKTSALANPHRANPPRKSSPES
ncbi:MAG TPA: hypothetical protein VLA72_13140 [Anaerolineales bacterium]|nr:hypothetical protein [Anaerolineales bacterium]